MENNTTCNDFDRGETWHVSPFEWFRAFDCLFILIGIIGNSLVIYVQFSLSEARVGRASSARRLVICLATADLLTAIFLVPLPPIANIPNNAAGKFYCHVINSRYLLWVSFRASVYTLTTIAIERFLAIAYPFTYKIWAHKNYVKYAIPAIWICPLIVRFPRMYFRVVGDCGRCVTRYPWSHSAKVYYTFLFLIEYLCPLIIMVYTNIRVIVELRRHGSDHAEKGDPSARQQSTQLQSMRRRFTIMFIFICASFMLLWTPDQLGIFLFRIGAIPRAYTSKDVFDVFVTISFLNAAVANPIIYSVCLPPFRRTVKGLLMCRGMDKSQSSIMMHMATTTDDMTASSA